MDSPKRWLGIVVFACWLLSAAYLVYVLNAFPSIATNAVEYSFLKTFMANIEPSAESQSGNQSLAMKLADTSHAEIEEAIQAASLRLYATLTAVLTLPLILLFLLLHSILDLQRQRLELLAAQQQAQQMTDKEDDSQKLAFAQWLLLEKPPVNAALMAFAKSYGIAQYVYYVYADQLLQAKEVFGIPLFKTRVYQMGEDLPGEVLASGKPCLIEGPNGNQALEVESGLGRALPKYVALFPFLDKEGQAFGLLEASIMGGLSPQAKKQLVRDAQVLAEFLQPIHNGK